MKVKDKKIKRSDLQIKVYKLKFKREEEESNEIRPRSWKNVIRYVYAGFG